MSDALHKANEFASQFSTWFGANLADTLSDNRGRYRMEVKDKDERLERSLSCLPSTKTTVAVDAAVDRALMDYHSDADAISFSAKEIGIPEKEMLAQWLTKIFHYRAEHTFPFFTWHHSSLTAGFTDGLEAAMVTWKKSSYIKKETKHSDLLSGKTITKEEYDEGVTEDNLRFHKEDTETEVVTQDTWWIDQLRPGEQLLWDFKIPYLDINLGQVALVKVQKTEGEVNDLIKSGFFDKVDPKELEGYFKGSSTTSINLGGLGATADVNLSPLSGYNRGEVWYFFEKKDNQWEVSFSLEGAVTLTKTPKKVNDVFFGGRTVDRLPIVLGTTKLKLWEQTGRGLPELIAPIEDEWIDHRNNVNDAAKFAVQGKWRIEPDSDVDIDDLINGRVFIGRQGDAEFLKQDYGFLESLKASDSISQDLNELLPVGMGSRVVVPKGTDKTLGAVQMAQQNSQDKLSVQLLIRNQTFFKPLIWLIAQLEFGYESDEMILKVAGQQAKLTKLPMTLTDGRLGIDISALDFDVDVQINAGLGSAPRSQKFNNLMQIVQVGQMLNVPIDTGAIFKQAMVIAGYTPEQFINNNPPPPPPPQVEYKLDLKATLPEILQVAPELIQDLMKKYKEGQVQVNTTIGDGALKEQVHNGSTATNTSGDAMPDMTGGSAAMGMSQGGQGGY